MTKTLKAIIFGVVAYIGTSVVIAIVTLVCMSWLQEDETIKPGTEYLFPIPQTEYYFYLADDYPYVLFAFTKDTLMDITDSTDYIVAKYYDRCHDYKADIFFTSHDQICIFLDHMLTCDEDWFACLHDSRFHVYTCVTYHEGFQQVSIYEKSSEKLAEYIKARLWIVGSYGVCWTDSCKNVNYINYTDYPTLSPIYERPISNEVRFIFKSYHKDYKHLPQ